MKKIGIITYHEAISFGAILQCYGLYHYLEKQGYEVHIIDYAMNAFMENRKKHKIKTKIRQIEKVLDDPKKYIKVRNNEKTKSKKVSSFEDELKKRNDKFKLFKNRKFSLSNRYNTASSIKTNPPQYDIFICGSDQIWNPYFNDFDDNYFLDFCDKNIRISYAPSIGMTKIPLRFKRELRKRLNAIEYLSIREESGAKIIKEITGKDAEVVIDPTFLLNNSDWNEISNESSLTLSDEYILTYFIGIDENIEKASKRIHKIYPNTAIIDLVFDQCSYGPEDFIKLVANAKCVITNSFHGCAFSINLNKPFIIIKTLKDTGNHSGFGRMENLLKLTELEDKIITDSSKITQDDFKIDYKKTNKRLQSLIDKSSQFLINSINNIKE